MNIHGLRGETPGAGEECVNVRRASVTGPFLYVTATIYKASLIMVNCSVKLMSVVISADCKAAAPGNGA